LLTTKGINATVTIFALANSCLLDQNLALLINKTDQKVFRQSIANLYY